MVTGINQPSALAIMATTFRSGDPSFAGPLAGVGLGLATYHIMELKGEIPAPVWEEQMAIYELELEEEALAAILKTLGEKREE